jgi:hypothetical protein
LSDVAAPLGTTFESRPNHHDAFKRAQKRQENLYDLLIKPGPGVLEI